MSSKRALRRKQCFGKHRYEGLWTAYAECQRKWKRGIQLRPYKCRFCGAIHIGHFRRQVSGKGGSVK